MHFKLLQGNIPENYEQKIFLNYFLNSEYNFFNVSEDSGTLFTIKNI